MNLARIQVISLFTKAVTTALGITQSVIVIRILTEGEYGLVGLVMSIGAVVGVSQHLGIFDGAIREIAVQKARREIGKVVMVANAVRQLITIPLSIGLLAGAKFIAEGIYSRPDIAVFIQVFALILILQGLQDVLGAALTGMKKFGALYAVQIVTASLNVLIFSYATWRWGIAGFFWGMVVTTGIMIGLLAWVLIRELGTDLGWVDIADIKKYGRSLMRIGVFMYMARIFFIVWQRLPILLLGAVLSDVNLGYLNIAQTFGSKLTIVAMALSEVNLSWMSSLFTHQREEFERVVARNMQRVLVVMLVMALVLMFFTPEILIYIIGAEYLPAQALILLMTAGFFLYALTDIGTSSVFVSADHPRLRAMVYGVMMGVTAIILSWLVMTDPNILWAAAAITLGATVSYAMMVFIAYKKFGVSLLTRQLAVFLAALALSLAWLLTNPSGLWRLVVFVLLMLYLAVEVRRTGLMPSIWSVMNREIEDIKKADKSIICFAGAFFDNKSWTNRQHIMRRMAKEYPVLYVEPRVWAVKYIFKNWRRPDRVWKYAVKILGWEKKYPGMYIISQWNLIPGSREYKWIAGFNHRLNRYGVLLKAGWLGFGEKSKVVVWIYDTEAAEYLSAFKEAKVVYDCVDDHAAQAGVDRNPRRVEEEEGEILKRADLVTVTSRRLYAMKKDKNPNVHLVLNAGDTELFGKKVDIVPDELAGSRQPIIGSVGALDEYKYDFDLLIEMAKRKKEWTWVFIGEPIVEHSKKLNELRGLKNVKMLGAIDRHEVPKYVYGFDVCVIPYRQSKYNESSWPLKFWEFMATGKPTVVSGLPELKEYEGMIGYAKDVDEFIKKIEEQIDDSGDGQARISMAREHSWEKRVQILLKLI